jgi:hypothetical protein
MSPLPIACSSPPYLTPRLARCKQVGQAAALVFGRQRFLPPFPCLHWPPAAWVPSSRPPGPIRGSISRPPPRKSRGVGRIGLSCAGSSPPPRDAAGRRIHGAILDSETARGMTHPHPGWRLRAMRPRGFPESRPAHEQVAACRPRAGTTARGGQPIRTVEKSFAPAFVRTDAAGDLQNHCREGRK